MTAQTEAVLLQCLPECDLDRLIQSIERLRRLDLSEQDGIEQALQESRHALGILAWYREQIKRTPVGGTAPSCSTSSRRQAA